MLLLLVVENAQKISKAIMIKDPFEDVGNQRLKDFNIKLRISPSNIYHQLGKVRMYEILKSNKAFCITTM